MVKEKDLNFDKEITREQWDSYIEVQKSGMHNMLSPDAARACNGLDKEEYFLIIDNYEELDDYFKNEDTTSVVFSNEDGNVTVAANIKLTFLNKEGNKDEKEED